MKILKSYIGKGKHLTFKNMPTKLMLEDYFRTQKNRKNKSFIIITKKNICANDTMLAFRSENAY